MTILYKVSKMIRDLFQILILDRFSSNRRRDSELASAFCRQLRFHSRSKIKPISWNKLLQLLNIDSIDLVQIPSPTTKFGNVGGGEYYPALAAITQCSQPKKIFEFGTYLGVSALTFAANSSSDCKIFTLDLPNESDVDINHELNSLDSNLVIQSRYRVGEAFVDSDYAERITQIFEDSMTFKPDAQLCDMDLVFVDGGHSTPLVSKDTENAFKMLSHKGIIVWDDYFHAYPDIVGFLDNLSNTLPLYSIPGTNLVIYSKLWDSSEK